MATVYSAGATRYNAGRLAAPKTWGCRVGAYYDEYEAANLAAASTLYMFLPCRGAKYAGIGQLAWDDLSGTGTYTLSVGVGITEAAVAAVVDAFLAATSVVAAADKADLDAGAAAVTYLAYEFDGGTWVTITTAGNAADATGTIKLLMLMLMPT